MLTIKSGPTFWATL